MARIALMLFLCLTAGPLWAQDITTPAGLVTLDGRMAPALALSDMDGKKADLKNFRGQWVLVQAGQFTFPVTWDQYCLEKGQVSTSCSMLSNFWVACKFLAC